MQIKKRMIRLHDVNGEKKFSLTGNGTTLRLPVKGEILCDWDSVARGWARPRLVYDIRCEEGTRLYYLAVAYYPAIEVIPENEIFKYFIDDRVDAKEHFFTEAILAFDTNGLYDFDWEEIEEILKTYIEIIKCYGSSIKDFNLVDLLTNGMIRHYIVDHNAQLKEIDSSKSKTDYYTLYRSIKYDPKDFFTISNFKFHHKLNS